MTNQNVIFFHQLLFYVYVRLLHGSQGPFENNTPEYFRKRLNFIRSTSQYLVQDNPPSLHLSLTLIPPSLHQDPDNRKFPLLKQERPIFTQISGLPVVVPYPEEKWEGTFPASSVSSGGGYCFMQAIGSAPSTGTVMLNNEWLKYVTNSLVIILSQLYLAYQRFYCKNTGNSNFGIRVS